MWLICFHSAYIHQHAANMGKVGWVSKLFVGNSNYSIGIVNLTGIGAIEYLALKIYMQFLGELVVLVVKIIFNKNNPEITIVRLPGIV